MLNSIYRFWKQRIEERELELEYARQIFSDAYTRLRLEINSKFLKRDCNEISTVAKAYEGNLISAMPLKEIISEPKDPLTKLHGAKLSGRKRNFFAHSGFLSDITKVSETNGNTLLRYDNESFEKEVMS